MEANAHSGSVQVETTSPGPVAALLSLDAPLRLPVGSPGRCHVDLLSVEAR